jgi:hypothetical protein
MARRQKASPYKLPNPTQLFDLSYQNQLVRQIEQVLNELYQPEIARGDGLYLDINTLPSTGAGLRPGTVFRDGVFLKIIREGDTYIGDSSITVALGTITVVTT